jgi:hypothetical protein
MLATWGFHSVPAAWFGISLSCQTSDCLLPSAFALCQARGDQDVDADYVDAEASLLLQGYPSVLAV